MENEHSTRSERAVESELEQIRMVPSDQHMNVEDPSAIETPPSAPSYPLSPPNGPLYPSVPSGAIQYFGRLAPPAPHPKPLVSLALIVTLTVAGIMLICLGSSLAFVLYIPPWLNTHMAAVPTAATGPAPTASAIANTHSQSTPPISSSPTPTPVPLPTATTVPARPTSTPTPALQWQISTFSVVSGGSLCVDAIENPPSGPSCTLVSINSPTAPNSMELLYTPGTSVNWKTAEDGGGIPVHNNQTNQGTLERLTIRFTGDHVVIVAPNNPQETVDVTTSVMYRVSYPA